MATTFSGKKIPDLLPAAELQDIDLLVVEQASGTRKATLGSIRTGDASYLTEGTLPDGRLSEEVQEALDKAVTASQPGHKHSLLDLEQGGASTGQIIKWNGTNWAPATDAGLISGVSSINNRTGDVTIDKTDVGLSNVENTTLSTWAGSTNITTVGTVTGTSFNSITGLSFQNPTQNGIAATGTSTAVARADHVHPIDTTRAATDQTMHIGTTSVAINRASGDLALTGITSIDGNAATATKLATARTINGVNFDGSANITISATDSTKLPLSGGTMTGDIVFAQTQLWPTFNQSTTGNAATATKLATARTINGVSFDGSTNITISTADSTKLPLAGGTMTGAITFSGTQTWPTFNQNTTGNAATSTKLETARTLTLGSTGKTFDGSSNVSWSLSEIGAQPAFTLTNNVTISSGLTGSLALSLDNNALTLTGTLSSDLKTVNGQSLVGSGDIAITTSGAISVSANTGLALTDTVLSTIYNTTMSDSVESTTVGGAAPAPASTWKTKTIVQVLDAILFPDVLPTYTPPLITLSGLTQGTLEVGTSVSQGITVTGIKNDAGAFTNLSINRLYNSVNTAIGGGTTSPTVTNATAVGNQFGYTNPNDPNSNYIYAPTGISNYTLPPGATTWTGSGNYNAGLAKKNNKGVDDPRTAQVRSTAAPQAAANNFQTSTTTITGIYPYYWGLSATQPTTSTIAAAISGGSANRVLADSNGTVSITFNAAGQYIWFAHAGIYTVKTKWYNTDLNQGNIGAGNFILAPVDQSMTANNALWTGVNYKVYISGGATNTSGSIQFRNN